MRGWRLPGRVRAWAGLHPKVASHAGRGSRGRCRSWWGHSFWWRKGRRSGRAKLYPAIKQSAWVLEDDQREGFAMGFMPIAKPSRA